MLKALRDRFPSRRIGLVCREKLGNFFLRTGLVDELFEIRKGDRRSYRDVAAKLRAREIECVYSAHSSFRTALFVRSLRAKDSVGFRGRWTSWAYRRVVVRPDSWPDVLRQMSLLAPEDRTLDKNLRSYESKGRAYERGVGGRLSPVPPWASIGLRDRLMADTGAWSRLQEKIGARPAKPLALLFPGSVWATKRWTEDGFVGVGRRLTEDGYDVWLMGAGNEAELAARVASGIPGARSLAGATDLYESALILARAKVMIGNDSASVHLASVAETPLVAIFGPTVIEQGFRPWSGRAAVVDLRGLACRPCGPHGHHQCPIGTHECMKKISVDDVVAAIPHNG